MTSNGDGQRHGFRYGAPAAVVDPLLSFLFDLRRMEDTVLSTLEHIGVRRRDLPRPFGGGSSASPPQVPATADDDVAVFFDVPSLRMPASDPIGAYAHEIAANRSDARDVSVGGVIHQLLSWLDSQSSSSQSSPVSSKQLLTIFATATGAGADVFLRDAATLDDTHIERTFQRAKPDKSAASPTPDEETLAYGDDSTARLVGTLTAADIHAAVQEWRGYERLLKSSVAEMKATLAAVTAARPSSSYSCHAKWVERTRSGGKSTSVVPASAVLKRNYEELISLNDALATCQAAVHTAYVALEDNLDVLLEEAQTVDRQERLFQHHVSMARRECAALHALRSRIKQARRALQRCVYSQRRRTQVQPR
ncbi:conserved hypothetical protein [Leishmania major strain Friedlin]|uniref:Uncharacterized protein n=1 Tax=Leishmania major TaxID=5664 RepID=Q4Q9K1_LEIMA|nr:conserved hypothetical protein [Leishmania major strain Friedlin]CAG9575260.1 hypothetical_protein_-_conserved [Leishmania major strain Friedlin]CAJ05624.1 conserved hypothetical protein [Leishmania major strain Friedlin]|eukprot:XP_001683997.1 conserved hypothetical protein [Leishmania major strain Friedlin]